MIKERREDCCYKKCSWFGHMTYQCRKKEIIKEKKRKLYAEDNKFALLLNKVCRRIEEKYIACSVKEEVQPRKHWGYRKEGHSI